MEKPLKKIITTWITLCIPLIFNNTVFAQVSVAFDPVDAYGFRKEIFGPFVSLGKVPISENSLSSNASKLPKIIPPHWQVVTVGKDVLINECSEKGRLMPLDLNNIPHKELLIPAAIERCGIGYSVMGTVLAYSIMHKYGTPPNSWHDFFDFNRYPGKRALPRTARHVMEIALLADGVETEEIYKTLATKEGQQRALDKLSSIYDDIIWWEDINNLQNWLTDGLIALAVVPDGAILNQEGFDNIGVSRNNVIYRMRYYAIPKSAQNLNLAYAFISFATQPSQQQNFSNQMLYGTTLKQGWTLVSPDKQEFITNYPKNLQNGLLENYDFYAQHGETLEKLFQSWLTSKKVNIKRLTIATKKEEQIAIDPKEFIGPIPLSMDDFIGPKRPENQSVEQQPVQNEKETLPSESKKEP